MGSAKTQFSVSSEKATGLAVDGLIIPVFKKPEPKNSTAKGKNAKNQDAAASVEWPAGLDKALLSEAQALATEEKFDAGRGKLLVMRHSATNKLKARRLIFLGLGEAGGLKGLQPRHWESNLQKAVGSALAIKDAKSVAVMLPQTDNLSPDVSLMLAVDAVHQATYRSAEAKDPPPDLQKAILLTEKSAGLSALLKRADVMARARSLVKDLVNRPANLKTTDTLVDTAKSIGKGGVVKVTVQSDVKWIQKNMPCFYTVARGSVATDPPKFITLRYTPKTGKPKKHVAVVGKSVIFDTGGYQVKPGDYMVTMKGDMTGGAVTLATMQALAELQPDNIEVTAYLAATPNKIDSDAMVPDSIVDTTCGKKVEIRHTDAEGRLTLIDAVAKALENKPDEIITVATLTGSASQAVGYHIALMGNNPDLRNRIEAAGRELAEPIQTLDVIEDDFDSIKSKLDGADIINTSQRKHRGAQTAAAFVMSGAPEDMPMAHMDIAGADMTADEKATGISLKTVLNYLLQENDRAGGGSARTASGGSAARGASKPAAKTAKGATGSPKRVSGKILSNKPAAKTKSAAKAKPAARKKGK